MHFERCEALDLLRNLITLLLRANTSYYCGDTHYLMYKSSFFYIFVTNFKFFQITLSKCAL